MVIVIASGSVSSMKRRSTSFDRLPWAHHRASVHILILALFTLLGCMPEAQVPPLGDVDERPEQDVIRLGGSILVTPIVKRLARLFVAQSPGVKIVVEVPLDPAGALRARADGRLDGALVVEPEADPSVRVTRVARSELVLALGSGIKERSFSPGLLKSLLTGLAGEHQEEATYFPPREAELVNILARRGPQYAEIFRAKNSRKRISGLDYGRALWEQVTSFRGGLTLADRGNLSLFGAPVWVGSLKNIERPFISLAIVTKKEPPKRLAEFLDFVQGEAGETALKEMGFEREGPSQ